MTASASRPASRLTIPHAAALVLANVLVAYPYLFAANELSCCSTGPRAHWTTWVTRPAAYLWCTPVVAVAVWRSLAYARALTRGGTSWWRLAGEAAAVAAAAITLISVLGELGIYDYALALAQGTAFSAGLGLVLTLLDRVVLGHLAAGPGRHTPRESAG